LLACALSLGMAGALAGCGDDDDLTPGPSAGSDVPLGNFTLDCEGTQGQGQGQKQQQVQFKQQQQQQQSCKNQPIQFQQQKVADFDFQVDCGSRQVVVKNKSAQDQKTEFLPIQQDGKVKGQMQFQQQVQNDGKGNLRCWVEYVVKFDGTASCATEPETGAEQKAIQMQTEVGLDPSTLDELQQAGIVPEGGASPSPSPSPSASPSPEPSGSPSPSPSPSASPSASPSPTPTVTPTVIPVTVCVLDDPCPYVSDADLSC
jgi:hypothetical protein